MYLPLLCIVLVAGVGGEPSPALFRAGAGYDVETTVVVNELAGKRRDVGYRVRAALTLQPAWADPARADSRLLIRFRLESPVLLLRGAHPNAEYERHPSVWEAHPDSTFYALWHGGVVREVYLDSGDPPDILNYKRALISLFQFQLSDREYNETDISGDCHVTYEHISPTVLRKIKRRCSWEAEEGAEGARARRVSRYTLSEARDAVRALHAEELVWVSATDGGGDEPHAVGVKARTWSTLTWRDPAAGAPPAAAGSLGDALAALPANLAPSTLPLPLPLPTSPLPVDDQKLEEAVRAHRAALEGEGAGEGGEVRAAEALVPLLLALRRASAAELRALLDRSDLQDVLPGVCRALGLAGSAAAWAAARGLLAPQADDALEPLALHYLAGLALSDSPQEEVVRSVLKLGTEARIPAIGEAALLAGAAAAARCGAASRAEARELLAAALARCAADECRAAALRALANLRATAAAELLVAAAHRHPGEPAAAALHALHRLPPRELTPAHLERAGALAANGSRSLPERALALELVAAARCTRHTEGVVPLQLVRLARELHAERGADAHELRRALWQRADSLAERAAVRALRRVLPRDLTTWDARAHSGTSSVLRRETGWEWGATRAQLDSVQVAARGLLRRGRVALLAVRDRDRDRGDDDLELLAVEVTTQGLEAVAGGGEGDGEAETPAATLQVSVGGALLPPLRLFSGQAELVGHIWAGTGAAPTPVVRALVAGGAWRGTVPLAGGAALAARTERAAALALDAHADVSLWHRTARARLALRVAGSARAAAALTTAWSELHARAHAAAQPRLRIAADLDFYDGIALCVRAVLDDHELRRGAELESRGGARRAGVRRSRAESLRRAGRTLALGRDNDAACRVLRASDPPEDEQ